MTEEELKEEVEKLAEGKPKVEDTKLSEQEEYFNKLKENNDRIQAELIRQEELKARVTLAGKADAGEEQKSPEQEANEEAANILKTYRSE